MSVRFKKSKTTDDGVWGVDDDLRPCKGNNFQICQAEGCYHGECLSEVCLKADLRSAYKRLGELS